MPTDDHSPALRAALRFHAGGPGGGDLQPPADGLLPALLHPYRDPDRVRHDYPLFLDESGTRSQPLSELLAELAESAASGADGGRMLRDNIPRLEQAVRAALDGNPDPADAATVLAATSEAVERDLDLPERSAATLHGDLEKLLAVVPERGTLLPLGEATPLHMLLHLTRPRVAARHDTLRSEAQRVARSLRDLARLHAGGDGGHVSETVGATDQAHFDTAALDRLLADRAAPAMDPARRERLEGVVETLMRFAEQETEVVHVVHANDLPESARIPGTKFHRVPREGVCRGASVLFDEVAADWARVLGALRIGRLELEGAYDPAQHDAFSEVFGWRVFEPDEIAALPVVIALESAEHLAGSGMLDLSQLLLSGRPVHALVPVQVALNPVVSGDEDPLDAYRLELGYLGVAHRDAVVNQTTAARPEHLLESFERSLDAGRPALHVVASALTSEGRAHGIGSWLYGGAALEGRAHPLFRYHPEAGETWARRLDFTGNPQPDRDWPVSEGDAFTFADFALLEGVFREHFRVLPEDVTSDTLVTVDAYLELPPDQALGKIPFLWAADAKGDRHRLVMTQRLAFACRDRLDYWHTLQELAGVRNAYVREAVEAERQKLQASFDAERDRIRAEATTDAMRRLAAALVRGDLSSVASAAATPPAPEPAPVARATPVGDEPVAEEPVAEERAAEPPPDDEPQEPWIESGLCTSCNDCLDINPRLFVYNENKQAVIGDPSAGTYEQLVRAAEKCPARCIHPGLPLDPDVPDREALIERARPFNP